MMPDEFYPGDEVKIMVGRYNGRIGRIVSTEKILRLNAVMCDVKISLDKRRYVKSECYQEEYTLITKIASKNLELFIPLLPEGHVEGYVISRKLLLIREDNK